MIPSSWLSGNISTIPTFLYSKARMKVQAYTWLLTRIPCWTSSAKRRGDCTKRCHYATNLAKVWFLFDPMPWHHAEQVAKKNNARKWCGTDSHRTQYRHKTGSFPGRGKLSFPLIPQVILRYGRLAVFLVARRERPHVGDDQSCDDIANSRAGAERKNQAHKHGSFPIAGQIIFY